MKVVLKSTADHPIRLSFPSLFEHETYKGQSRDRYAATFLIPKNHPQVKELQAAIKEVGSESFGAKWAKARLAIEDGDEKELDGYEDCWSLKAATKKRPKVRDRANVDVHAEDELLYAGCNVNASVSIYAFSNDYGNFVSAQLNGVQFHSDNEPFGGNGDGFDDDDFDSDESPMANGRSNDFDDEASAPF